MVSRCVSAIDEVNSIALELEKRHRKVAIEIYGLIYNYIKILDIVRSESRFSP